MHFADVALPSLSMPEVTAQLLLASQVLYEQSLNRVCGTSGG